MKSKISVLAFAFLMSTVVVFAKGPASALAVVPVTNQGIYKLYYKSAESNRVRVSIYGSRNELVFTEVLNNVSAFVRPYNFSELKEGQYTIIVEDKNGEQVEKINYAVIRPTSVINVTEVPNSANSKYFLNVANDAAEDVSVRIYEQDQLLHEEVISVKGKYGVIYNLSKVNRAGAQVTFEIVTSGGATKSVTF